MLALSLIPALALSQHQRKLQLVHSVSPVGQEVMKPTLDPCFEEPLIVGSTVGVTGQIRNLSESVPLQNVHVDFSVGPELAFKAGATASQGTWDYSPGSQSATLSAIGTIPPGGTVTYAFELDVIAPGADILGYIIFVQGAPVQTRGCTYEVQAAEPLITVTKNAAQQTYKVGDEFVYNVIVLNDGDGSANSLLLVDLLPETVEFKFIATGLWSDCTYVVNDHEVRCTKESLPAGGAVSLGITVKAVDLGSARNSVIVSGSNFPESIAAVDVEIEALAPQVKLAKTVEQVIDPHEINIGNQFIYKIEIENTGDAEATGLFLSDIIPDNVEYIGLEGGSDGWTCDYFEFDRDLRCQRETLAVGSKTTLFLLVEADFHGDASNTVTLFVENFGELTATATATILEPLPAINAQKTVIGVDNQLDISVGTEFAYLITVSNNGEGAATNLTLVDVLPDGLIFIGIESDTWQCSFDGSTRTVNCSLSSLATPASTTVSVIVEAATAGNITNIAVVQGANFAELMAVAEATIVEHPPQIIAEKTIEGVQTPLDIPVGTKFTYLIRVKNMGDGPAYSLTLEDILPDGLVIDDIQAVQWQCDYSINVRLLQCTLESLAPGAIANVLVMVEAATAGFATNIVTVIGSNFPQTSASAEAIITESLPNIVAQKLVTNVDDPFQIPLESEFTYEIKVANTGVGAAFGIVMIDILPETVIFLKTEADHWNCSYTATSATVTCTLPTLAPGDSSKINIHVVASSPGIADNEATVVADGVPEIITGVEATISNPPSLSSINGMKFVDLNGNGLRDMFDAGYNGVVIELLNNLGAVIAQDITRSIDIDGDGKFDPFTEQGLFSFSNIAPGTYSLREKVPANFVQTLPGGNGMYNFTVGNEPSEFLYVFANMPLMDDLDFGDLPQPRLDIPFPGCPAGRFCYQTTTAANGPAHLLTDEVWLGLRVDAEADGQPSAMADGDDGIDPLTGDIDDEDGLYSAAVMPDGSIQIVVFVTILPPLTDAILQVWIDLDNDGTFDFEQVINTLVVDGLNTLTTAPGLKQPNESIGYMRMRISTAGGLASWGLAPNGEVEDYLILGMDFGDAPESKDPSLDIPGGYPTNLAQNGARHIVNQQVRLGDLIDAEGRAISDVYAEGDDDDNQNDEDGIVFENGFTLVTIPDPVNGGTMQRYELRRNATATFTPLASIQGRLSAWIDWNRDGDWDDADELIVDNMLVNGPPDYTPITIQVPRHADPGLTFARFRFSRNGGLGPDGPAPDGEVEDYMIHISSASPVGLDAVESEIPFKTELLPNYPNPFNPVTQIPFTIEMATNVELAVYTLDGRLIRTLVQRTLAAGQYSYQFDGSNLSSGVYLYRLRAGGQTMIRKLVLVK